jgi:hypothetical protein
LAIKLGVVGRAEPQCDVSEGEELGLEHASELWVAITHNGARHVVELGDVVEEGAGDRDSRVVAEVAGWLTAMLVI